jgi:hypothetical protein
MTSASESLQSKFVLLRTMDGMRTYFKFGRRFEAHHAQILSICVTTVKKHSNI